jgi:hypothetical protein
MAKQAAAESGLASLKASYPALTGSGSVQEALAVNLGGEVPTVWDLERIKVPSGSMKAWQVEVGDGGAEYPTEVEGIIVFTKIGRAFWRTAYADGGGGAPPDCSSPDGLVGIGDPGGECATCPFAQFGSARDAQGREAPGQACKQMRFVFLLRPGSALPSVIALPPTSLKAVRKWLMSISARGRAYWTFVTKFTLVEATNQGGTKYAQARCAVVRELNAEEAAVVQEFAAAQRAMFSAYREGATGTKPSSEAWPEDEGAAE